MVMSPGQSNILAERNGNMRLMLALSVLACLGTLVSSCGAPAPEQLEAVTATTEPAAVSPTEAPETPTSVLPTITPQATVAESTPVPPTAMPAPVDAAPVAAADEVASAPAQAEAADSRSEEGRVTFKSPSLHGEMTASGEPFDKDAMTAAHKTLPFGTVVTVTNLFNGLQTTVTVNDRLPPQVSAIIDLSPAAAEAIDMIDAGIVDGRIEW
jgi:rare lipoprotein A